MLVDDSWLMCMLAMRDFGTDGGFSKIAWSLCDKGLAKVVRIRPAPYDLTEAGVAALEDHAASPGDTAAARDGHLSTIQARVWAWCSTVFADRPDWQDKRQRVHRFIEEAVELAQACEIPQHEVERLVGYVYGRPVGEPSQELGGTVITLAALAEALGLSAEDAALTELERVERPEVMEKVRRKQVGKDALFAERPPSPPDQRPKLDEWKLAADFSRFGYLLMRNGWTGYELDDGAPGLFSHCWTPKQLAVQIRQDRRATVTFDGKVHKVSTPLELRETLDRIAEETSNV